MADAQHSAGQIVPACGLRPLWAIDNLRRSRLYQTVLQVQDPGRVPVIEVKRG